MKKDTAAPLPVIPPEPMPPTPREGREPIFLGDLFSLPLTRELEKRRPRRRILMICIAALCALILLTVAVVWMSGGWRSVGNALQGFWQGGAPPIPTPPVGEATDKDVPRDPPASEDIPSAEVPTQDSAATSADSEGITDSAESPTEGSGTDTEEASEAPTDAPTDESTETPTAPPLGYIPIVSLDRSEKEAGVDHVTVDSGAPRLTPADQSPFDGDEIPAVLLIHTHPLEGYSSGGAWYDPSSGGLAQTPTANAPDGVVALGMALTRYLREQGVTVIHLRVPAETGDTASTLYGRVEGAVEEACRLYPQIGLILDLRRAAELTEEGDILRTLGSYQGDCAQVRISVHGHRSAAKTDLAVAMSLRRCLWGKETSLSCPVRIRDSKGIAMERIHITYLTLELGAAGNTYAEAGRLILPLGSALISVLSGGF